MNKVIDALKEKLLLEINIEYPKYLRRMAILEYKNSIDKDYQEYIKQFNDANTNEEKWAIKCEYIKKIKNKNEDENDDNVDNDDNDEEMKKFITKYIEYNNNIMKENFMELAFNKISLFNNITIDCVKKLMNEDGWKWDWGCISSHNNITYDIIKSNPELPWTYEGILANKNIKFEELKDYIIEKNKLNKDNWIEEIKNKEKNILMSGESISLNILLQNKSITENDILNNMELDWSGKFLSANQNISWQFIIDRPNWDWNYNMLFSRPNTTWDEIIKYGEMLFDNFNKKNILSNFNKSTVNEISKNKNITWNIIKNNINEPWDWNAVSLNPNITMQIILNNPEHKWNIHMLILNKSISLEELKENNIAINKDEYILKIMGNYMTCYDF